MADGHAGHDYRRGMLVYDFGMLPGDIAVTAIPPPVSVFAAEQPVYAVPLNVAQGRWSTTRPQFTASVVANVFRMARDGTTMAATNHVVTQQLLPGDANRDGAVDGSDFGLWNAHKFMTGTDWGTGDFDGNGVTDGSDFNLWNAHKFTSLHGIGLVPEPSSWFLIVCIIVVISSFRITTSMTLPTAPSNAAAAPPGSPQPSQV